MTKFECACQNRHCYAENTQNDKPSGCMFYDHESNWRKSEADTPLPKLTAAVFDRPYCPDWARFAVVDKDGDLFIFDKPPVARDGRWWLGKDGGTCFLISYSEFDASDWKNSLIERPAKLELPAWCKVGAWARHNGKIGKITGINHTSAKIDIGETGHFVPASECRHVTWRPWTVDEIVPLLPLFVRWKARKDKFTSVICTAYDSGDVDHRTLHLRHYADPEQIRITARPLNNRRIANENLCGFELEKSASAGRGQGASESRA